MKKGLQILLMFALIGLSANAQVTFQKSYGQSVFLTCNSMQQTSDGGYILLGTLYIQDTIYYYTIGSCFNLIKTDANGDTLWTKFISVGGNTNYASTIVQTNDGGYFITGTYFDGYISYLVFIKTDSNGNIITSYDCSVGESIGVSSSALTTDGKIVSVGTVVYHANTNAESCFLMVTNDTGKVLAYHEYGAASWDNTNFYSVQVTNDGGFIVVGNCNGLAFTNSITGTYLIKTDNIGNIIWADNFNANNNCMYLGCCVRQTNDGGFIVTGLGCDVYLTKIDNAGNLIWSKNYQGIGIGIDYFNPQSMVYQTADGGYFIGGNITSYNSPEPYYIIKTDSIGNLIWSKKGAGGIFQKTNDGGFITTGFGFSLIKYDSLFYNPCSIAINDTIIVSASNPTNINAWEFSTDSIIIHPVASNIMQYVDSITTLCTTVGINEVNKNDGLSIYPNPATSILNIQFSNQLGIRNYELEIIDILGNEVYHQLITHNSKLITQINISQLSEGVYFYRLTDRKETYRGKFVKESY